MVCRVEYLEHILVPCINKTCSAMELPIPVLLPYFMSLQHIPASYFFVLFVGLNDARCGYLH